MSSRDTRTPVEVVQIGRVTLRIFDMEEYLENAKQYHQEGQGTVLLDSDKQKPKKLYTPFPRRSYGWHKGININQKKRGA